MEAGAPAARTDAGRLARLLCRDVSAPQPACANGGGGRALGSKRLRLVLRAPRGATTTSRASVPGKGVLPNWTVSDPNGKIRVRLVNGLDVMVVAGTPKRDLALVAGAQRARPSANQPSPAKIESAG